MSRAEGKTLCVLLALVGALAARSPAPEGGNNPGSQCRWNPAPAAGGIQTLVF